MTPNIKEVMVQLCELVDMLDHDKDLSLIIAVSDDKGTVHTIRPSQKVEEKVPMHLETALIILSGVFYNRYIRPDSHPKEWDLKDHELKPQD